MERLLGSICQPLHHSSPTGSSRGTPDPTPRGTPCLMDTARNKLQTRMADVKKYMVDIAHASHHLDHLAKTVETNRLPKGLTVEPRMMLIDADEETAAEWKEQTRRNTLGYIDVAKRHYKKQIARKTEAITDCQRKALESISDPLLTDKQRRVLKGSYEELLNHAEKEAKAIKRERDQSSQSKLEEGERPPKRPKTSQQRNPGRNKNKYPQEGHSWRDRTERKSTQTKPNPFRLKSIQTPKPTDCQDLENLINRIRLTMSQIHPTTGWYNLPRNGMSIIKKLSKEHDVIINTADKGSSIVLLDREKYVEAGRKHLDDKQTYTRLTADITDTIKKTITIKLGKLCEMNLLSKSHYKFCLPPADHRTSLMYFLIKLHKNPHAYRPICSCVNTVTSNISRFLDHWLKQAVRLLPSYISDSTHFIKTIEDITFAKDILLCSIDVTNMYTNIPIDEGNRAAIRALENLKCQTDMPNMAALTELLDLITKNNVFGFDGEFYIQTKGVPMGNIMAPSYSGIFMGELETRLIDLQSDKIKLWVRYIDDIFVAWQGTQTDFDNFVQQCNKLHTSIKFTSECSTTEINFLDMTVFKGPNFQQRQKLDMKTFKKPTNKQAYVHGSSFHPPGIGKSIALGESYRALRTNTDKTNFLKQIDSVQNALLSRGYKQTVIKPLIRRVRFKDRHTVLYKNKRTKTQTLGTPTMVLTYNTHVSQVRKELNKIWEDVQQNPTLNALYPMPPRIAQKKNRSLGNILVSAKLKKQTPREMPPVNQPIDVYQHCRVPAEYPRNILKHMSFIPTEIM
ncbi:hypothetical protein EMCRGX_G030153 [Ephydatia muelleri]|eukprot:Em0010g351a